MDKVQVCCVDAIPFTLVFRIEAVEHNPDVFLCWDIHNSHGTAYLDWLEEQTDAPHEVGFSLLYAYQRMFSYWSEHTPTEYELVSVQDFVKLYAEG